MIQYLTKKTQKYQMIRNVQLTGTVIFILTLLILSPAKSDATPPSSSKKHKWLISGSVGMAILSTEFSKEYVILENEFRHQPGWAFDISAGRTIGRHWEPAIRFSLFTLSGDSDSPDFTANGNHPSFSGPFYQTPVEYVSLSGSLSGVVRFYFREVPGTNVDKFRLDPYIEAGGGVNSFATELRYKTTPPGETSPIIFQKGVTKGTPPTNVAQAIFGLGTKIGSPKKWQIILSYTANVINYACLDGVHNYTNGVRNHANGIVSKFTAGIVIPLGTMEVSPRQEKGDNLPWAN
ncbi:hypothetical protein D1164_03520 [Mariniphaga sediminis]|uniref:Outer membrane protein beta-barrel domain-containing protein n=1 Tax=Mariniphaga sediminis TaxID=1628158 RepID=A0A399D4U5_9BACT|nr:hypothetical protein [Mariniphaga sediminis]RIH66679.1 hypothetical protein D1164_03520 [Mariniphaga sediminis]